MAETLEFQRTAKLSELPDAFHTEGRDEYGDKLDTHPYAMLDREAQLVDKQGQFVTLPVGSFMMRIKNDLIIITPDRQDLRFYIDQNCDVEIAFTEIPTSYVSDSEYASILQYSVGLTREQVAKVVLLSRSREEAIDKMLLAQKVASFTDQAVRNERQTDVAIFKEINLKVKALASEDKKPVHGNSTIQGVAVEMQIKFRCNDEETIGQATVEMETPRGTFTFESGDMRNGPGLRDWRCRIPNRPDSSDIAAVRALCQSFFGLEDYKLLLLEAMRNFRGSAQIFLEINRRVEELIQKTGNDQPEFRSSINEKEVNLVLVANEAPGSFVSIVLGEDILSFSCDGEFAQGNWSPAEWEGLDVDSMNKKCQELFGMGDYKQVLLQAMNNIQA